MEDSKNKSTQENKLFEGDFINDDIKLNVNGGTQKSIFNDYSFISQIFKRVADVFEMLGSVGAGFLGYKRDDKK